MQRFSHDTFWERYGEQGFDETDLAKALKEFPSVRRSGPWLCGGAVRRLFLRQPCDSDFDFFFRDETQLANFAGELESKGATEVSENDFNITMLLKTYKVQLIRHRYFERVEDVLASFDFSLCQFGYDGEDFITGPWALWDAGRKKLVPERVTYATSTLRRIIKYTRQGYTICGGACT